MVAKRSSISHQRGVTDSPMIAIFEECQETSLSHDRLCESLMDWYRKLPFNHFAEEFFELCRYSLISSDRTPYRERTLDFIVRFAVYASQNVSSDNPDESGKNLLLIKTFLFCAKYHETIEQAPRFRCTQLIHKLLQAMGTDACLPVELFDIIQRVLLRRAQDVKHTVRMQAAQGLSRLQNPTDKDCPVVQELVWLARHDKSPDVRRTALASAVLTTVTLSCVVERCRDVSDTVRKTAYNILAERSVLRPLSIAKRIAIIQDGLTDTSHDVRKAAENLVMAWFKSVDQDPILLLRRLDTEGVPKTSRLCLDHLLPNLNTETLSEVVRRFAGEYLDDAHVPKLDQCSVECAFFWRVISEYLLKCLEADDAENNAKTSSSELLEVIMPSVIVYVDFVIQRVDNLLSLLRVDVDYNEVMMEAESVLEQVLAFCDSLDLSDEFGRRRLFDVVRSWLVSPSVPASLTASLLQLYFTMESSVSVKVNTVTEMITELLDSAEEATVTSTTTEKTNYAMKSNQDESVVLNGAVIAQPVVSAPPSIAVRSLSKAQERSLRVKAAELRMKIIEINDSLMECISAKNFERATVLRDECARLENEHTSVQQELTGTAPQSSLTKMQLQHKLENVGLPVSDSASLMKQEVDPVIVVDENSNEVQSKIQRAGEEQENEDYEDDETAPDLKLVRSQIRYLSRLSPDVVLKANRMVGITVQKSPTLWSLLPSLRSLLYSLVLPSVQHNDLAVRNQAILALGLCCTMDLALTKQYLVLFFEAVKLDHATVGVTALNCILDSLLIFGLQPFLDAAEKLDEIDFDITDLVLLKGGPIPSTFTNDDPARKVNLLLRLLSPLLELIESEDADLRTAAGLGLCKLFLFDRIQSGQILSRIVLLWFNPQTADLPALSQSLGIFFTDYACSRADRQACLADACLPTLNALLSAPATSPLAEVDAGVVVSLLVRLTDSSCLLPDAAIAAATTKQLGVDVESTADYSSKPLSFPENPCHDDLAMRLCNRILNAPQSSEAKLYIRVLSQLHLSVNKPILYKDLLRMVDLMLKHIDRSSNLSLHRFRKNIYSCIESSGLKLHEFLASLTVTDEHLDEESETDVAVLATPSLLGPAMPSSQLDDMDPLPGRRSVAAEKFCTTLAGLSFCGPSISRRLLVFSDDDDDNNNDSEEDTDIVRDSEEQSEAIIRQQQSLATRVALKRSSHATVSPVMPPPPAAPRTVSRRRSARTPKTAAATSRPVSRRARGSKTPLNTSMSNVATTRPNIRRASTRGK